MNKLYRLMKKFMATDAITRAAILTFSGFAVLFLWECLRIAFERTLLTDAVAGLGGVLLSAGACVYFFYQLKQPSPKPGVKSMSYGAFGLCFLFPLDRITHYVVQLGGADFADVTLYYALPLMAIFFYGLFRMFVYDVMKCLRKA